jgi:hypothetical protein
MAKLSGVGTGQRACQSSVNRVDSGDFSTVNFLVVFSTARLHGAGPPGG